MEQENQEIDYKAEYEKMVAEKERNEVMNNFRKVIDKQGYVLDEENFSAKCESYDNATLNNFVDIINSLSKKTPTIAGRDPVNGGVSTKVIKNEKLTFNDVIKQ